MLQKIIRTVNNMIFTFKYVFKIKKSYIFLLLLSSIVTAINSIYSIIVLKLILDYLNKGSYELFVWVTIFIFMLSFILTAMIEYLDGKVILLQKILIEQQTNLEIFRAISNLDIDCYDQTESYDNIFFNLSQGNENMINLIQNFFLLLTRFFSALGIISIIGNYNWSILLVIFIFVVLNAIINIFNAKLNFKKSIDLIPSLRGLDYIRRIFYLKQYASEIRIFNLFEMFKIKYQKYSQKRYKITGKYLNYEVFLSYLQTFLQLAMQIFTVFTLAYNYFMKKIVISDFLVVYNSIIELNDHASSIVNVFPEFYKNSLYIEEFRKLLRTKKRSKSKFKKIHSMIIKDICFNYDNTSVIENLNLSFKEKNRYAIIGNNGTGKTTLLKIISGLYSPTFGQIYCNGVLIEDKDDLSDACSVNFQDHQYYATTIAENILARECNNKSDEVIVWDILKEVGLFHRVNLLASGIHTVLTQELDEAGTTFSGGEIERLTIARALVNVKSLMVFDEPTSALDTSSRKQINDLIFEKCKDQILIYVTHDLNDLDSFDQIINLDEM